MESIGIDHGSLFLYITLVKNETRVEWGKIRIWFTLTGWLLDTLRLGVSGVGAER